ncbi:MAG TPA: hypothetical protein VMB34_12125, partial [Acetobacteraceae bacterium]|nr:hypothetical protein [Acetobacteraceae bacterium]
FVALSSIFKAQNAKGIFVDGPLGGNNAPGNVTVSCGNVPKRVSIIHELGPANAADGNHITGAKSVTVTAAAIGGNCYWLPWGSWRAYWGQLGAACSYFVTANLTGCAIYVSGTATQPHIVHANCAAGEVVEYGNDARAYNDDLVAARMQFYGQLAEAMVDNNTIPSAGLQMLRPDDYGARTSEGYAVPVCVFGVKTGGNWTIYYCVGGRGGRGLTRTLFPAFQKL